MKVKLLVAVIVALVIVNIAALGSFWYMHWHGEDGGRSARASSSENWSKDLSAEERERLTRTVRSFRQEVQPLIDQTRAFESDLFASMQKDPVPRAHIDSLLQAISRNRLQIARRATDRVIAMGDSIPDAEHRNMMRALRRLRTSSERDGDRNQRED